MPQPLRKLFFLTALWLVFGGAFASAQTARDCAVELTATVQETPPKITLQWKASGITVTGQQVYRRLKDASTWTLINSPSNAALTYADSTVSAGVNYEYYVTRSLASSPFVANGYVASGIRIPVVVDRGRVILFVDDTMAVPLDTELTRLASDLAGDGWTVVRQDVSRTATPPSIRARVQSIYNASPTKTVALILFGHIPVPYSGNTAMDGHDEHVGAWPSDVYYGDINGNWTDSTVNNAGAGDPRNRNVPGDGKFDQTSIPSNIDLEVGRIDLANMISFGASETELLRRYLDRDHAYRFKLGGYANVGRRGLIDDLAGYGGGEAPSVVGWRSFTACVGAGNVQELDWFTTLPTQSYLWAYGDGPGTYVSAGGIGSSYDFAGTDSLAVFTLLFGSFFGDWDVADSFLRAPLAGTTASLGLTCCWSCRPHWYFHPMALGETTGYCARLTQNNSGDSLMGYEANVGQRLNHIALMGDPTLRLYPVMPATNLTASGSSSVTLNWSASVDSGIQGYLVERSTSAAGPFVQLPAGLVTSTTYVDGTVTPGVAYTYLVRAVKLETSPTGTYLNTSQGVFTTIGTAASIAIYPPAVNRSIHASTSATETLTISNSASGTLVHSISSSLARYRARDSDSFGGPVYGWTDISSSGTRINGWSDTDNGISSAITMGLSFPYYGNSFTTVRVCTNGYLSFTDTNTNQDTGPLPNASAAANMIAPLWADLVLGTNSRIYRQALTGKFVVQFEHMALVNNSSADLTFEVILQSNGEILFQYKTLTALTTYAIGIQNSTRDDGLLVAQSASYVHTGMAVRIRPPGVESWLSLTASSGTVQPGGSQQIGATLNTTGLTAGNYYAELIVSSNASGQESITIPVRLTVGNTPVENWRLAHFGSVANSGSGADTANADGDGGNNLIEYAFSRDPAIPEKTGFATGGINGAGYLQVQFDRDATRTDLSYIVEATSDLSAAWTAIATSVHGAAVIGSGAHSITESGTGDVKTVIVEDAGPIATYSHRFLRVRITRD